MPKMALARRRNGVAALYHGGLAWRNSAYCCNGVAAAALGALLKAESYHTIWRLAESNRRRGCMQKYCGNISVSASSGVKANRLASLKAEEKYRPQLFCGNESL